MPFSALIGVHHALKAVPDYFGGYTLNPLVDLYAYVGGDQPLPGSKAFAADQRASGTNAVLWHDPSMIL
jgi:hypothetical protein